MFWRNQRHPGHAIAQWDEYTQMNKRKLPRRYARVFIQAIHGSASPAIQVVYCQAKALARFTGESVYKVFERKLEQSDIPRWEYTQMARVNRKDTGHVEGVKYRIFRAGTVGGWMEANPQAKFYNTYEEAEQRAIELVPSLGEMHIFKTVAIVREKPVDVQIELFDDAPRSKRRRVSRR